MITIPANIDWDVYSQELTKAEAGEIMNFKVFALPVCSGVGAKCYLCYKDKLIGYMIVCGIGPESFTCITTGTKWDGNFIQRTGKFFEIEPVPYKGFRGFRYLPNNLKDKIKEKQNG